MPAVALKGDLALDGVAEIPLRRLGDGAGHMTAEAVANIEMLAAHGKLHASFVTLRERRSRVGRCPIHRGGGP